MDRILVKDLLVRCVIGVTDEERRDRQDVVINLELFGDFRKAGLSDNFENAVDYRAIKKRIVAEIEASKYHLVEALAERVAAICLEDTGILSAEVTVEKPSALRFARSVGVQITRGRD